MAASVSLGDLSVGNLKKGITDPDNLKGGSSNESTFKIYYVDTSGTKYLAGTMHVGFNVDDGYVTYPEVYYSQKISLRGYFDVASSVQAAKIYVRLSDSATYTYGMYGSSKGELESVSYTSATRLSTFPTSASTLAVIKSNATFAEMDDKTKLLAANLGIYARLSASEQEKFLSVPMPDIQVVYSKCYYKCTFDPGLGSGAFESQMVAGTLTVKDPGTPVKPEYSATHDLVVSFDNKGGTPATDSSTATNIIDTWQYKGTPDLSTVVRPPGIDFKVDWTGLLSASTVLLPSIPVRTGYIFQGWYDTKTDEYLGNETGVASSIAGSAKKASAYAKGKEEVRSYKIYYTSKGEAIEDSKGNTFKEFSMNYTVVTEFENLRLPVINGFEQPVSSGLYIKDGPGDSSKIGQQVDHLEGTAPDGTTYEFRYTPYICHVTLDLNGGTLKNDLSNKFDFNILDGELVTDPESIYYNKKVIGLYNKYQPVKENATFVGGVNTANTKAYCTVIIPKEEIITSEKTYIYKADYINLGTFVFVENAYHPVINKWIYDGTAGKGENTSGDLVHTNTTILVYGTDNAWHVEYGKDDI